MQAEAFFLAAARVARKKYQSVGADDLAVNEIRRQAARATLHVALWGQVAKGSLGMDRYRWEYV